MRAVRLGVLPGCVRLELVPALSSGLGDGAGQRLAVHALLRMPGWMDRVSQLVRSDVWYLPAGNVPERAGVHRVPTLPRRPFWQRVGCGVGQWSLAHVVCRVPAFPVRTVGRGQFVLVVQAGHVPARARSGSLLRVPARQVCALAVQRAVRRLRCRVFLQCVGQYVV